MEQHSLPGARFVDPKVLARIGNLELLAKTVERRRVEVEFADPVELADVRAIPGVAGAEYARPTLEEVFLTYYREEGEGEG